MLLLATRVTTRVLKSSLTTVENGTVEGAVQATKGGGTVLRAIPSRGTARRALGMKAASPWKRKTKRKKRMRTQL